MRALPIVHVTNRRYAGRLLFSVAALGLTLTFASSCAFSVPGRSARVVRRFPAHEATQAVAVDAQFFYAIDDAAIGKYQKDTGQGASKWEETPGGPVTHLNSGIVQDGLLYCAHSNYPGIPMVSSVEVFDTAAMTHVRSIPLPPGFGSATWVDRADGQWWVTFAQYAGKGGEAGKGPEGHRSRQVRRSVAEAGIVDFPGACHRKVGNDEQLGRDVGGTAALYDRSRCTGAVRPGGSGVRVDTPTARGRPNGESRSGHCHRSGDRTALFNPAAQSRGPRIGAAGHSVGVIGLQLALGGRLRHDTQRLPS